jgi:HPt (histidine-containing phosphotransfer) domain-containing protein
MSLDDNKNPIDIDFLRKIIGNDLVFEKELFEIFLDNSKYNISKLDIALKSDDNNSWYMAAHALKGSSASIGAFPLSRILEIAQKSSDLEIEKKVEIFYQVKEEFKKVEEYISQRMKDNS